jgi:leader peptidase (prepilin peptidase)/N-methyltransferase
MLLLIAAIGLAIGSFLNVTIGKLRSGETGWRSRSQCPRCHAVLRPTDLVPVVSFIALRGKCRTCRKPISWQYPVVEVATMALFVVAFVVRGGTEGLLYGGMMPVFIRDTVFVSALMIVFVIDLLDMVVYDAVTIPMVIVAAAWNLWLGTSIRSLALAIAIGAGFFLLQHLVSRGRWIGGGDIRIGAMIGAMLGFPGVVAALLLAYASGAVVAIGLLAAKKTSWSAQMAFGTFLSFAAAVVLFFGEPFWAWYAGLLGL